MTTPPDTRVSIRPDILALAAYRQGRPAPADAFKLSSNENPFEPLPEVLEAIAESTINRYPDASAATLRARIAERHGVEPARVHVGAGSVAILAQLIQAAAGPGDEVVYAWRSFEAYPSLVVVAGATSVQVPLTANYEHDLPAMAAAITTRTRLVLVCTPNNPTGTIVSSEAFAAFMAKVPSTVLVVLDEAYTEFIRAAHAVNGMNLLDTYPNLVVLRTFSKAYGLAGLRIGYAIGPDYVLDAARATAIPLSVIEQAQRAALAALDHEEQLLQRVRALAELRDQVWAELRAQGWKVPEAHGNFVWLPTGDQTTRAAATFLAHGIVVRPLGNDGVRVSIGEAASVDNLLAAAKEVVGYLQQAPVSAGLD